MDKNDNIVEGGYIDENGAQGTWRTWVNGVLDSKGKFIDGLRVGLWTVDYMSKYEYYL